MANDETGRQLDDGSAREREKWRAYPDTVLHFATAPAPRIDLREALTPEAREALAAIGLRQPFAVLTAENPEGQHAEDARTAEEEQQRERANAARTATLERALDDAGVFHTPVDGSAPDGSYRERCVAVRLPREEAVQLAERLGQLALFWYDGERFWLLPAEADQAPTPLPAS